MALVVSGLAGSRGGGYVAFARAHHEIWQTSPYSDVALLAGLRLTFGIVAETVLPAEFIGDRAERLGNARKKSTAVSGLLSFRSKY